MKNAGKPSPAPIRLCSICGTRVAETATRCIVCGADLGAPARPPGRPDPQPQVQAAALEPPHPPTAPYLPAQPTRAPAENATQPRAAADARGTLYDLVARVPLPVVGMFGGLLALLLVTLGAAALLFSTGAAGAQPKTPSAPRSTAPATYTPLPTSTGMPPPSNTPLPPLSHLVEDGDSCTGLALLYSVSVESILKSNALPQSCPLRVGQEVMIPQPTHTPDASAMTPSTPGATAAPAQTRHVVVEGESLQGIAEQYGVDFEALAEVNNVEPPDYLINVGMELIIPPGGSARP